MTPQAAGYAAFQWPKEQTEYMAGEEIRTRTRGQQELMVNAVFYVTDAQDL